MLAQVQGSMSIKLFAIKVHTHLLSFKIQPLKVIKLYGENIFH